MQIQETENLTWALSLIQFLFVCVLVFVLVLVIAIETMSYEHFHSLAR